MQYLMFHHLDREGRIGCFTFKCFPGAFGLLCSVTLPQGAVGLSAECDGGTCIS